MTDINNLINDSFVLGEKYGEILFYPYLNETINNEKQNRIKIDKEFTDFIDKYIIDRKIVVDNDINKSKEFENLSNEILSFLNLSFSSFNLPNENITKLMDILLSMIKSYDGELLRLNKQINIYEQYVKSEYMLFDDEQKKELFFFIPNTSVKIYPYNMVNIQYALRIIEISIKLGSHNYIHKLEYNDWVNSIPYSQVLNFLAYIIEYVISLITKTKTILNSKSELINPILKSEKYYSNRVILENKINLLINNPETIISFKSLVDYAKEHVDHLVIHKKEVLNKLSNKMNNIQSYNRYNTYLSEELYSVEQLISDGHNYFPEDIQNKTTPLYHKKYKLYIKSEQICLHEFGSTYN